MTLLSKNVFMYPPAAGRMLYRCNKALGQGTVYEPITHVTTDPYIMGHPHSLVLKNAPDTGDSSLGDEWLLHSQYFENLRCRVNQTRYVILLFQRGASTSQETLGGFLSDGTRYKTESWSGSSDNGCTFYGSATYGQSSDSEGKPTWEIISDSRGTNKPSDVTYCDGGPSRTYSSPVTSTDCDNFYSDMLSYNVSQWTDDSWNANRALQIPTDTSGYLADNFSDNVGTASTPTYGGLGNSSNSGIYTGYDSNHTTHQFSESEIMFSAAFLPVGNYTIHVPMIQRTLEINKDTGAEYGPWAQLPTETFSINVTDPLGVAYSSAKAMNAPVGYERRIMTHEFARDLYPDCSRVFYDDEFGFPISFDNLYLPLIGVTKL